MRKQGVVLSWTADGETAPVRLQRKLLTPPAAKKKAPLAPAPEPMNETSAGGTKARRQGRAMDATVRMGETYEYRAQRVSRVDCGW